MTVTLLIQTIERSKPTAAEHQRFLVQCLYRLITEGVIDIDLQRSMRGQRLVMKLKTKETLHG